MEGTSQARSRIYWIGASKGGVGKSILHKADSWIHLSTSAAPTATGSW
jgi:hypothetical protein